MVDMNGKARAAFRAKMGIVDEWFIRTDSNGCLRLCSHTHDDDVELAVSGNFSKEQRMRVTQEICDQLNEAERKYEIQQANPRDPDSANVLGKINSS